MEEVRVGRNAPCPCGSGKKYKRCCLELQQRITQADLLWQRCTRANDRIAAHLSQQLPRSLDPRLVAEASRRFYLWQEPVHPLLGSREIHNVFYDWLFFRFIADPLEPRDLDLEAPLETVGRLCLERQAKRLSELERRILGAALQRGNSLVAVRGVEWGRGLLVEDLFTGEEFELAEREGSKDTEAGMILFAHIAALPELPHLLACSPLPLPASLAGMICERADELRPPGGWTPERLSHHDDEIRDLYFEGVRASSAAGS